MRALFHLRPPAGTESHISEVCGSVPASGVSIAGERLSGGAGGYLHGARDSTYCVSGLIVAPRYTNLISRTM